MKCYEEDFAYDYGYEDLEEYDSVDNFDFLFDSVVANRGEAYYKNGLVVNLVKKGDKYKAKVIGTYPYDVEIKTEDDKIVGMECNCPYHTENHNNCKHMYAVLKSIKEEEYDEVIDEACECPVCKSKENVIPIMYGRVTKIMMNKLKDNKVKYGGGKSKVRTYGDHKFYKKWYCKNCHEEIYNNGELDIPFAYEYLGKIVDVIIDSPIGTINPKYGFIYSTNFGHVFNTVNGDKMGLDCYLLGEFGMMDRILGKCIALIKRGTNDYKLVVVPLGKKYDENQIQALTEYQERFFKSKVIA